MKSRIIVFVALVALPFGCKTTSDVTPEGSLLNTRESRPPLLCRDENEKLGPLGDTICADPLEVCYDQPIAQATAWIKAAKAQVGEDYEIRKPVVRGAAIHAEVWDMPNKAINWIAALFASESDWGCLATAVG